MSPVGKLLIVEDEPEIRELLTETLADSVEEIQTANDGLEALEKIRKNKFDAILSDINMPRMDGMSFLRQLRVEGILTPFVVLTGHGDKKTAIEALRLNAFDFLDKPWKVEEVKDVITRAIELGLQYNEWTSDPDLVEGLQNIRTENATEAIYRLKKSQT